MRDTPRGASAIRVAPTEDTATELATAQGRWLGTVLLRFIMRHLTNSARLYNSNERVSTAFIRHLPCRLRFRFFRHKYNYFKDTNSPYRLRRFYKGNFIIASSGNFFSNVFRFTSVTMPKIRHGFLTNTIHRLSEKLIVLLTRTNSRGLYGKSSIFKPLTRQECLRVCHISTMRRILTRFTFYRRLKRVTIYDTGRPCICKGKDITTCASGTTSLSNNRRFNLRVMKRVTCFVRGRNTTTNYFRLTNAINVNVNRETFRITRRFTLRGTFNSYARVRACRLLPITQ